MKYKKGDKVKVIKCKEKIGEVCCRIKPATPDCIECDMFNSKMFKVKRDSDDWGCIRLYARKEGEPYCFDSQKDFEMFNWSEKMFEKAYRWIKL